MAINSVSPGSYNSPSVQPLTQQPAEKAKEVFREDKKTPPPPERPTATVNTNGQAVGMMINTKA